MPSLTTAYEVLLEVTNDTSDPITVEILREGIVWNSGPVILLRPHEGLTLILEAGSTYKYTFKNTNARVANVKVRSWRDLNLGVMDVFPSTMPSRMPGIGAVTVQPVEGVTINYIHRDVRSCPPS
ncbi:hypothetical protein SISNIDRAFT_485648 [Sistotremastrum niveocremeum HHB9708]|uniref:Uncharacterized protein n=2 Tax=Sistotremastraceae TaxID=3402574 RepID=A0A164UNB3_9AGAM|nr:hypothetical protein SISNIDRAFT_485648 [Sistotremastrum niveocremeum HHB9708]KZT43804.1 hypothetical protein SISSUDRAFT_1029554 [Sistotremastrum suecicum HHB10207 ss-3]